MMSIKIQQPGHRPRHHRWWRSLRLWERIALVVVVLGALAVGAGLIYFQPGGYPSSAPSTTPRAGAPTAGPEFPPGTRWYYQRGQWVPQDQQMPVQP